MNWFWRKPPDPLTHLCRFWRTIASDTDTYIEECTKCGRQRARIYRRG